MKRQQQQISGPPDTATGSGSDLKASGDSSETQRESERESTSSSAGALAPGVPQWGEEAKGARMPAEDVQVFKKRIDIAINLLHSKARNLTGSKSLEEMYRAYQSMIQDLHSLQKLIQDNFEEVSRQLLGSSAYSYPSSSTTTSSFSDPRLPAPPEIQAHASIAPASFGLRPPMMDLPPHLLTSYGSAYTAQLPFPTREGLISRLRAPEFQYQETAGTEVSPAAAQQRSSLRLYPQQRQQWQQQQQQLRSRYPLPVQTPTSTSSGAATHLPVGVEFASRMSTPSDQVLQASPTLESFQHVPRQGLRSAMDTPVAAVPVATMTGERTYLPSVIPRPADRPFRFQCELVFSSPHVH
uniref:Uncharacterized protein n=1 Tax=Lotharella globosa TaxID=91324 RepID=A0A7S4DQQ9_9EUKA|mmetsp:Transcript_19246/g.38924  ORF Transcript_19246/g.38924 Transcript_19246/m.38924 type:complete len:354 (+) Transcript_19246:174-1235(+)|eukprot:CAMPEP_0167780892 /NCGR_PEP_ID=MMETSP0111_2-20121227/5619_1 /TAXON_ID=91324 /ORGANISM="Lotharella globosa, Strain CCCM811" /LENGTH=353 /DNA_ID=CAMNT_0007671473 /DNA_START=63 /DNA_END=1124 /DNA_ORIENTATION=+